MNLKKLEKQISTLGFLTQSDKSDKDNFVRVFNSGSIHAELSVTSEESAVILQNEQGIESKINLFSIKEDIKKCDANFDKGDLKKIESLIIRVFNKIKNFIPEPEMA